MKKTKKKFVPLFSEGGTEGHMVVLLPGRHPCQCLAVRHRLVNNCTHCGRIVCEQEGAGSCFLCGNLVATAEDRKLINSGSKQGIKLFNQLKMTPWAPGTPKPPYVNKQRRRNRTNAKPGPESDLFIESQFLEEKYDLNDFSEPEETSLSEINAQCRLEDGMVKAVLQRDRLLLFDATTEQRTRVIDDELDYFVSEGSGSAAAWLDPETRARVAKRVSELRAQRFASRLDSTRLCIDLTNKCVYEEDTRLEASRQLYSAEDDALLQKKQSNELKNTGLSDALINVPIPQFLPRSFVVHASSPNEYLELSNSSGKEPMRVQDNELRSLPDRGLCLSMHQPWASMLVRGIKMHEGRSWYSAHRGPLWISAASKLPEEEQVKSIEAEYLARGARSSDFPSSYPTACILGCVDVEDVLPQQEYRTKYPNGESNSPFVFICKNARELIIKLPIRGEHKIYKLNSVVHTSAKANLS